MLRDAIKTLLLIRNRPGNVFSNLPKKIIIHNIGGINPEKALEFVIDTDYESLFTILSIDSSIMFKKAKAKDINGKLIETSPLKYALYVLDVFAWNLCYFFCQKTCEKQPLNMKLFQQQVQEVKEHVDLHILFDAYNQYIKLFDLHEKKIIDKNVLLNAWLNVGKAQHNHLPRHMLREMCFLPLTLQPASHDIILLSLAPDDILDTNNLNEISKSHHCRHILIKQNQGFIFYKFDYFKNKWNFAKLSKIPFKQINFPEQFNCPEIKKRESNPNNFKFSSQDYWKWTSIDRIEDCDYLSDEYLYFSIQDAVFENTNRLFEELLPLSINSKLGVEYTLARGSAIMCFAMDNPTGHQNFLKHKAADDLLSFDKLLQKRILERESLLSSISNIDNFSNNQLNSCRGR